MKGGLNNMMISSQYTSVTSAENTMQGPGLGKDDFLKLLIAELRYQDPLDPMDSRESISQLAQFNSLEQMQNLNETLINYSALGMIGKHIETYGGDISGIVKGVNFENGNVMLIIGDEAIKIPLDMVQKVREKGE
ncbi:MAG: flagellar hook capping protein [Thermoanaerobacterales bacterium]|jgi:flagellar basal-body rod modification protein FlgD|nr:flagellar hook capping protein [Thermoanaerobacterales bacterium]